MKETKDNKKSVVLFSIALVLFAISIVTGLMPGLVYSIDKISGGLGFACFCYGLTLMYQSKDHDNK